MSVLLPKFLSVFAAGTAFGTVIGGAIVGIQKTSTKIINNNISGGINTINTGSNSFISESYSFSLSNTSNAETKPLIKLENCLTKVHPSNDITPRYIEDFTGLCELSAHFNVFNGSLVFVFYDNSDCNFFKNPESWSKDYISKISGPKYLGLKPNEDIEINIFEITTIDKDTTNVDYKQIIFPIPVESTFTPIRFLPSGELPSYNHPTESIIQTEIELHKRFKNLDVIGFDMDLTAVNYNNVTTGSLIYYSLMLHLVEIFPFFKDSKIDFTFCKRGLVIDMENGLILKLNNKKQVTRAYRGNKIVATSELDKIYHNASIESGPLKDYDGTHSARFFSMVSFFETPVTCIYRDFVVHLEREAITNGKDPLTIDYTTPIKSLTKEIMNGFAKNFNDFTKGYYYEKFNEDPSKFIYKASDKFKEWLGKVRSNGTKVLLVTNSKSEYTQAVMNYAFGENFKEYFDCIIVDAKKPDFFTGSKPFIKQHTYHPKVKSDYILCDTIELNSKDSIFKNGNINIVMDKIREEIGKKEISFCFVGDNILCDIVSPKQVKLMTVAIIEELQYPEEIVILKKKEKQQSTSAVPQSNYEWGSFFHVNDHNHENLSIDTYWSHVLKNHADIAVSTVDTLVDYYYADKFDNEHLLTPCAVVWSKE